ncbi:MAG: hypothetical protein DRH89_03940, partial [Candidatus Cloacimonadota bacterium]
MKKELIFIITLFLMINTVLIAQTPEWQWVVQADSSQMNNGSAIAINDNGIYISGGFGGTTSFGSST